AEVFYPHVVFSDIRMPDMSGLELAEELRKSAHSKNVFLIAVTGSGDSETAAEVVTAGFDVQFTKPFDYNEVSEQVRNFFERHSNLP
ncbi:MAG: response regulator, partial [Cytophagaceae bacterium]